MICVHILLYYVYFYSVCISPITLQHPHDSHPSNGHEDSHQNSLKTGGFLLLRRKSWLVPWHDWKKINWKAFSKKGRNVSANSSTTQICCQALVVFQKIQRWYTPIRDPHIFCGEIQCWCMNPMGIKSIIRKNPPKQKTKIGKAMDHYNRCPFRKFHSISSWTLYLPGLPFSVGKGATLRVFLPGGQAQSEK